MQQPETPILKVKRLRPDATAPRYMTPLAAGLDLAAALDSSSPISIIPGAWALVPTGIAIAIPAGYEGQVRPRSGLAAKFGVTVLNAPGTIDSDYVGELKVILVNLGREPFVITHGDRIAQLIVAPVARVEVAVLATGEDLDATDRAAGGFGSTGR